MLKRKWEITKTTVVLSRALHAATREYFKVKSSPAVQLSSPQDPFQVH